MNKPSQPDTPYTLRSKNGQWIAHALAFDLVGADADKEQAVAQLKLCLGAQIAYARGANCFFPAPVEYWEAPYEFMAMPTAEELAAYKFTPMTESRRAMTAQQFAITAKFQYRVNTENILKFADALSAHNTAQLQKEVERTKGYDAVLAEVGKLQGIVEAGDVENVELQAALEAARNEKAMLLIELQKYHIAERLRSQGAGPPSSLKDWNRCPKCHQEISRGALLHVCLTGLASPPESKP